MRKRKTIAVNYFKTYKELLQWLEPLERAYQPKEGYTINITNSIEGYYVEVLSY